ncbi:MAG: peptidylprolyl isomerase [Planctomycetota bacterium]
MLTRHRLFRAALSLLLIASLVGLWRAQSTAQASSRIAARAGEQVLAMEELETLLLQRHAFSEDGRDILRHLVQTRMIEYLGDAGDVRVGQGEINRLWDQLDRDAKKAGVSGGMAAELKRTGMTPEEFRELLRLQILQQVLTRRALGLADDASVSGEQMAVWIDAEIQKRKLEVKNPPWDDGVVAVCGEVKVTVRELAGLLTQHLGTKDVRDASFHLLLLRGIRARMPDLSGEAHERAIDSEMASRRREVEGDAAFGGLSFESLLGAQGMTVESLRRDPSVAIAALSNLWIDRTYDQAGLREAYDAERAFFEDRYGEAVQLHALFLRGAKFKNKWNPRTFEEAEAELNALKPRLTDRERFIEHARSLSEDPRSKASGGELGWVTRGDDQAPPSIRDAAFNHLGTGGEIPAGGLLLGPVRLENGLVLLWLSARRDSPDWAGMSGYVRQELRRRFLTDVLAQEDVQTFRDG